MDKKLTPVLGVLETEDTPTEQPEVETEEQEQK